MENKLSRTEFESIEDYKKRNDFYLEMQNIKFEEDDNLEKRFNNHTLNSEQQKKCEQIRYCAKRLAYFISSIHECRETSLALTKLEEVVMWANAGISRNIQ